MDLPEYFLWFSEISSDFIILPFLSHDYPNHYPMIIPWLSHGSPMSCSHHQEDQHLPKLLTAPRCVPLSSTLKRSCRHRNRSPVARGKQNCPNCDLIMVNVFISDSNWIDFINFHWRCSLSKNGSILGNVIYLQKIYAILRLYLAYSWQVAIHSQRFDLGTPSLRTKRQSIIDLSCWLPNEISPNGFGWFKGKLQWKMDWFQGKLQWVFPKYPTFNGLV